MENADAVQFMSISELAELSGVADATVTRFCHNLEFKGFNTFKIEIAKSLGTSDTDTSEDMSDICALVAKETREAVDESVAMLSKEAIFRAVEILEGAERVMCYGVGGSMLLAMEFAHIFSSVSTKFTAVSDQHMQLSFVSTMKECDAVVIFSYSGATKAGMELLEFVKRLGIKAIIITRFAVSPMARLCDVVLCCGSKQGPYQMGSVPSRIAQLVVSDVLFREYVARNKEESEENIRKIAAALSDKHI